MQPPLALTISGAGLAWKKATNQISQLAAILARPDNTVALQAKLYVSDSEPVGTTLADLPSDAVIIADFVSTAAGPTIPFSLDPDGISLGGYLVAAFTDSGTAHALYCYVK